MMDKPNNLGQYQRKVKLACPDCGFERKVMTWFEADGTLVYRPPYCNMCELRMRASNHLLWAQRLTKQADAIERKRKARRKKA